jgi:hypothetical protein
LSNSSADGTLRSVRLVDVQRLLGNLIFCCNVVDNGRFFIGGLSDMCRLVNHPWLTISKIARTDARWWIALFCNQHWSGIRLLSTPTSGRLVVETDASKWGGGCYWPGSYMYWKWSPEVLGFAYQTASLKDTKIGAKHINMVYLELRAIVELLAAFGPSHRGFSILVRSDNMPVAESWSSTCSKSSACRPLFCTLTLLCQYYSITLTITHIAGLDNIRADPLSRNNLHNFFSTIQSQSLDTPTRTLRCSWPIHHGLRSPGNV